MPSTQWKEAIQPDEAMRHAAAAQAISALQARKSAKFGTGRALHRKGLLVAPATLTVANELPAHAAQGLFAQPGCYRACVRLSNGGVDVQSNKRPDIRGFAFRVWGPTGESALGGTIDHQDFSLINQVAFAFPTSHLFFGLVLAAGESPAALLKWVFKTFGPIGALRQLKKMAATFKRPFPGFAAGTFGSTLPLRWGPYAAKLRLLPLNGQAIAAGDSDFAGDFARQAQSGPLRYAVQAQFFEDETRTPIEDASVEWPETVAPFITVAELAVSAPSQDPAWTQQAEAGVYDPWQALAAHQPLGEVMRARKVVYFASQQGRGAA